MKPPQARDASAFAKKNWNPSNCPANRDVEEIKRIEFGRDVSGIQIKEGFQGQCHIFRASLEKKATCRILIFKQGAGKWFRIKR